MGELRRKAEKEIEKENVIEVLNMLNGMPDAADDEKKELLLKILDRIGRAREELDRKIEMSQKGGSGTIWDFSKERCKDVFVEDGEIILRNCRDTEKDKYIQIKKENPDFSDFCFDEFAMNSIWQDFNDEKTFCCSMIRKCDSQFIGYISIKDTKANLWEIAIEILQEYRNQLYGSKALGLFLPTISAITNRTQFQALVETDNIPGQKIVEKMGARLIDIYDYTFHGDEETARIFEEKHLSELTARMVELAEQIDVEPRKMLSHVLDYRFFIEDGKIVDRRR